MHAPKSSLSELDVPVENLFFIDQLIASEQALHLLHHHLRGLWPLQEIAAAMQSPEVYGSWVEALGYDPGEVLHFESLALVDHRPLFRARLASYYGNYQSSWTAHRVKEDFELVTRPGGAGILLGMSAPPDGTRGQFPVFGYLLAVRLHGHPANGSLPQLAAENIVLCDDLAVVGGWLQYEEAPDVRRFPESHN
ncbi:MAG: hypothetical protein ABI743_10020 [bacterium]